MGSYPTESIELNIDKKQTQQQKQNSDLIEKWIIKLDSFRKSNETGINYYPKAFFDEWASEYKLVLDIWGYNVPQKCVNAYLKYCYLLKKKEIIPKILDVGTGSGLTAHAFKESQITKKNKEFKLYGCDLSRGMLDECNKLNFYDSLKEMNIRQYPWPYESNTFDSIIISGTSTFIKNPTKLFNELLRISNDKSIIIMSNKEKCTSIRLIIYKLEKDGHIKILERKGGYEYLPNHHTDKHKYEIFVFQNQCTVKLT